ncbi:MAG: efflux transporter periplasmic adaptor subunit [Caulobacteraceae bacterium]|nr:efflux transporter periplasmic adaptor subunit [Caulobacteraceae bacterium]
MPPNKSEVLRYTPPARLKLVGIVALVVAAGVVATGLVARVRADRDVRQWTHEQVVPTVGLVSAKADNAPQALTLPAQIQAFQNAGIHSRVPGYLKAWHVDIGDTVRKGQLLAEIDTPDLDQQLAAARADLATARANEALSRSTAARWKNLLARDAVSQQEYEEKAGDLAAKSSVVNAASANVGRLQATAAFKRIVAPFDGVITTRSTDIGALISAGNAAEAPLFTVSQVDRLRVYVNVPQSYSAQIHKGMTARLTAPERPGESFTATVVGDAQAISAQTGSLLVQLQFDNRGGKLKAGGYAQASLALPGGAGLARIPASALITDEHGVQVATVGPGNRVVMRKVTVGRDLGPFIELSSGLAPNEKVIDSPPDDLTQGDVVKIAAPTTGKAAANG